MTKKRLTREQILTIPNAMSAFRLVLIPLYLYFYCARHSYWAAIAVLAVSALTDVLDGRVARKFNMVSDVGKVLDPVADKLTQGALMISLCTRYRYLIALTVLFALKEFVMAVMGGVVLKKTGTVNGAKWYGKLGTVWLEASMAVLVLFPNIPMWAADGVIAACAALMLFVLIMYLRFYFGLLCTATPGQPQHRFHAMRLVVGLTWAAIIGVAIAFRDVITVDSVLSYTPHSTGLAILFLMLLYALKSVCVVVYIGILYLVGAIMFPVPLALAVGMAGTIVSVTVPYLLGRRLGADAAERVAAKNEKLTLLRRMRGESDFLFSLISRWMLFLPSDIVSFYMGAARLRFWPYIFGCAVGFAPLVVLFTFMGDAVTDLHAPRFWITVAVLAAMIAASLALFGVLARRQKKPGTPEA